MIRPSMETGITFSPYISFHLILPSLGYALRVKFTFILAAILDWIPELLKMKCISVSDLSMTNEDSF